MSINFDRDAFWSAYHRAANANPMRADCPPADEAYSIRESAIQELTTQYIELIMADPEEVAEAFACGYEEARKFCKQMIEVRNITESIAKNPLPVFNLGVALDDLVARHAMRCAEGYLDTGNE